MNICFVVQSLKWWASLVREELPFSFLKVFSGLFSSFNFVFPRRKLCLRDCFIKAQVNAITSEACFVVVVFFFSGW